MTTKPPFVLFSFLFSYIILIFGIRLGIDVCVKYFQWGYNGESYAGMLSFLVEAFVIVFMLKDLKKQLGNHFTSIDGIKASVGLMLVAGALFSIYIFLIHAKYIDVTYQQRIVQEFITHAQKTNPNMNTEIYERPTNAMSGLALWILKYIFIGAIVGIPTSIFLAAVPKNTMKNS